MLRIYDSPWNWNKEDWDPDVITRMIIIAPGAPC